ncbi:MAG: chromosome partitioning protein ParB, partial [Defluviitaleaceae bacterium]|nr:chromosome partitioning protein ParB [Defluviitaleaceae bacterium]
MPKNNIIGGITLTGHKDIFKSTANPFFKNSGKSIVEMPLADLHPPEFHPFQVNDDEAMTRLCENIKRYGVREPGLVRPL